jgi:Tfp pilus assembly protein PilV
VFAKFLNPASRSLSPGRIAARRGLSVLEATMSLLILSFAIGGLLEILSVAAGQRRATEVRRLALQEVANHAEQIALLPWTELTADKLAALQPSAELLAAAPSGQLAVTVADDAGPPAARQIRLTVTWTTPSGEAARPVQLTVWRHQP